jgi:hypothetical protein
MIRFAVTTGRKIIDGLQSIISEVFQGDASTSTALTIPGIESLPFDGDKVLIIGTDKNGKKVAFGVPLKTDIAVGEVRIVGRDEAGEMVSHIYQKKDGTIEIGKEDFKKLINESFKDMFNSHTHLVVAVSAPSGPPIDAITQLPVAIGQNEMTKKLEAE